MAGISDDTTCNMRDGVLVITDEAGTPNSITLTFVEGDFSWEQKQNVFPVFDRGTYSHMRQGNDELLTWSFTCKYNGVIPTEADESAYEALTKTGDAASWTSTTSTGVYTVNLEMTYTDASGSGTEEMRLDDCAYQVISFSEGDEYNTIAFSGISGATAPVFTAA